MVCRLKYDEGEDEESIEWVDFRELTVDEIKQHPAYPVVQRPPAAARPTPPVPSPTPRPHEASTTGRNAGAEQVGHLCSLSKGWHSKPDVYILSHTTCKFTADSSQGNKCYGKLLWIVYSYQACTGWLAVNVVRKHILEAATCCCRTCNLVHTSRTCLA